MRSAERLERKDQGAKTMTRTPCPSKAHFARCVTDVEGRPSKVTWRCDHCGEHVISGEKFKPINARIHLAAERTYGICGNLCRATDDHARGRQQQFRTLIKKLAKKKAEKLRKRKQQDARIKQRADASKKKRQPKIGDSLKADASDAANFAVAQWAIAHDIPANALKGPYWRQMNAALSRTTPSYKPMNPQKLNNDMLPVLKKMADDNVDKNLKHAPAVGRTVTGDGATKHGIALLDFLTHVPGAGTNLLEVIDCTEHIGEGGSKDAL